MTARQIEAPSGEVAERVALLDVLIAEHRNRAKAVEDRLASTQTTIGAVATGVVALAALLVPRLPYERFGALEWVFLGVSGVAGIAVVVVWIDALVGPLKSVFASYREAVESAAGAYEDLRPTLAPVEVRIALLDRLRAEEVLAMQALEPREESLRMASWLAGIGLTALMLLAAGLIP